jgi:transketolase
MVGKEFNLNSQDMSINAVRILSAEAIQKANSGHPGLPMGAAPMTFNLWANHMKHNPKNPQWFNRDRFVLSSGHGSMLLYSLLHLFDYGVTMEDLKSFRQLNSKTPGHPEYGHTVGVEMTTGPLGQGISSAVGMAWAESYLAETFNKDDMKVIDHYTYAVTGDGGLMEGISSEASSLAGTLGFGKLIVFYDDNSISIEGCTDIAFREDVKMRYEAYGWQVIEVADGNDLAALTKAVEDAKAETKKPTLIKVKTLIGYGCPEKQGKASAHGEPLGAENLEATKANLEWKAEPFTLPGEVTDHMKDVVAKLATYEEDWNALRKQYEEKYPEDSKKLDSFISNDYVADVLESEGFFDFDGAKASRASSGEVINKLAKIMPNLIGGSADLAPSNKSRMNDRGDFTAEDHSGSNLHFGVREHAMTAIANGMALHGGLVPYIAGFFVFADYMKPGMRLAALMGLPVTYVLTHDSIGVGEDGPTHQPIEHLTMLRSIPNFNVFRPADYKETAAAWYSAVSSKSTPTALVLSRQNLQQYENSGVNALKGGYILKESTADAKLVIVASGSEVGLAMDAAKALEAKGTPVRVVSMPCMELFDAQDDAYKASVLPAGVKKLAVEAAIAMPWYKYVGTDGDIISIERFGASGPANEVYDYLNLTVDAVVERAEALL